MHIKLEEFTEKGHGTEKRHGTEKKRRKAADLDELPSKLKKTRKINDIFLRFFNALYKQSTMEKWMKRLHPALPQVKVTSELLRITVVSLTAAKVSLITLLLNPI